MERNEVVLLSNRYGRRVVLTLLADRDPRSENSSWKVGKLKRQTTSAKRFFGCETSRKGLVATSRVVLEHNTC